MLSRVTRVRHARKGKIRRQADAEGALKFIAGRGWTDYLASAAGRQARSGRAANRIFCIIRAVPQTIEGKSAMSIRAIRIAAAVAFVALAPGALAQTQGNADAGSKKASMCQGCHGVEGYRIAYPAVYAVPRLGGQHPQYIVAALQAYKRGERPYATMRSIAASLSDQDMADLAAYYGQGAQRSAMAK